MFSIVLNLLSSYFRDIIFIDFFIVKAIRDNFFCFQYKFQNSFFKLSNIYKEIEAAKIIKKIKLQRENYKSLSKQIKQRYSKSF